MTKNINGIKSHRKTTGYLQVSAKKHLEAAMHYQEGNHEKAVQSAIVAHPNFNLVYKAQRKDMNQHAIDG
ncbi:hypothetical protein BTO04_01060 [Polaribacter sp. SA4-10]|uniref:hypothetical protein n=1 Tax=Polaribacter sp. SA4-10 TaxID=754397 RepID=UPI000B3D20DF|nr:hypothetical protein [Polaribacter sp. SA4-10]ARV05365.1 hypothetical protein BTO04_01060 [Polaribacter sp. SA4-10]